MKTNRDMMLKYLSGLLEGKEKSDFEKMLETSSQARDEFNTLKNRLAGMKDVYESSVDESYFNGLLPRMREKLDKSPRQFFSGKLAYIIPVAVVILIMTLFIPRSGNDSRNLDLSDIVYQMVAGSDSTELSYNLLEGMEQSAWVNSEAENPFDVVIPEHWDIQADNYAATLEMPVIDEINGLANLPNDKLDQIYKNLASLK